MRDKNFVARNEDRPLHGAAVWKRNPKGNSTGNALETFKDRRVEIVINGPPKNNVHEEMRAAPSTM